MSSREETMFNIIIKDNYDEVSTEAFKVMKEVIKKENCVLGLATGSSPVGLYKEMIKDYEAGNTSYKNIRSWNLDEYVGIPHTHEQSYWTFMHENLFNHIDIKEENVHVPCGEGDDIEQNCKDYEKSMEGVIIDLQVLGIGSDGHIAFNEPGTPFDSLTHIMDLTEQTRQDNARFFDNDINQVPTHAVTMGLASIMRARKIVLIATGANKADAVHGMIKGALTTDCPASILQAHPDVTVVLDKAAAAKL